MALVLVPAVLVIVPGNPIAENWVGRGGSTFLVRGYEHGYPLLCLRRVSAVPQAAPVPMFDVLPAPLDKEDLLAFRERCWSQGGPDANWCVWSRSGDDLPFFDIKSTVMYVTPEEPQWWWGDHWPLDGLFQFLWLGLLVDFTLLVLLGMAAACVLEWWRRRSWRFGIRGLLFITLVVALLLSWIASQWRAWEHGRAIDMRLMAAGFLVDRELDAPLWMRRLIGSEHLAIFQRLRCIRPMMIAYSRRHEQTAIAGTWEQLSVRDPNDQTIQFLRQVPEIRELTIEDSRVDDEGFAAMAGLVNLETLKIQGNVPHAKPWITAGEMRYLAQLPKLRSLTLECYSLSEKALELVKAMRRRGVRVEVRP